MKKASYFISKVILFILFFLCSVTGLKSQDFFLYTNTELILDNGVVKRVIQLPEVDGNYFTKLYKPVKGDFFFFDTTTTDFQFYFNNKMYSGKSKWILKKIEKCSDSFSGRGALVALESKDAKIELTIQYLMYPGLPAIRKNLIIKNLTNFSGIIESVDIEKLDTEQKYFLANTYSWVCHDYGRRRSIGPYKGNAQDALVIIHNSHWRQGIVIGNEASGITKNTTFFNGDRSIVSGLTHKQALFPFRKHIKKGESFTTPQVFTMVYNNHKDPDEVLNTYVADFVRNNLGSRLGKLKEMPTFVYNTWEPFNTNINENLILELAKAAAAAGMKEFIIDDGWQKNYGDWEIDSSKFPNGLKPIFDYIKSLGMKPGLWLSVGSASTDSKVFKKHPAWFVLDEKGKHTNLHQPFNDVATACFGTGWYHHIKNILSKLSLEYGLEYMKLDFTVVTSPYKFNSKESGCYATNHKGHIDHNESLYSNYEEVWKLFDELHAIKPDLFIDCTFETLGGLQLIDYAMLKHADGNWLSNFAGPEEKIDLRIRNMAWWRSPAMPATALVIGNAEMQDSLWYLHCKSLAGALPILLGDPRKLQTKDLIKSKNFSDWLQAMENRYQIMRYRQDLYGFGEPKEGMWDGFQRINTENKKGGILGIFRHGATETKRMVTVQYLDSDRIYSVKLINGEVILTQSGKDFKEKGFEVQLNDSYGGELFEICEK